MTKEGITMLDKEAQQALVALMNTNQHLEDEVLKALRNPDLTTKQIVTARNKYLEFLEKLEAIEADLEAHQHGTEEDWIAMWKGQTDEDA
jgi:hypothetical protein